VIPQRPIDRIARTEKFDMTTRRVVVGKNFLTVYNHIIAEVIHVCNKIASSPVKIIVVILVRIFTTTIYDASGSDNECID
jgi:hypothetical protein